MNVIKNKIINSKKGNARFFFFFLTTARHTFPALSRTSSLLQRTPTHGTPVAFPQCIAVKMYFATAPVKTASNEKNNSP